VILKKIASDSGLEGRKESEYVKSFKKGVEKHSGAAALWPTTASEHHRRPSSLSLLRRTTSREKQDSLSRREFFL